MGRCMFSSCDSDTSNTNISFYSVPLKSNSECARLWLSRAKRADLTSDKLTTSYRVCGKHFSLSQLEPYSYGGLQRSRVKYGELPYPNGTQPPKARATHSVHHQSVSWPTTSTSTAQYNYILICVGIYVFYISCLVYSLLA